MAGYIASMRPGDVVCASREARYKNLRDELSQLDTPVDLNIGSAYGSTRDVSQGMRDIAGVVANVFAYTSIAGAALFYALTSGSADAKQMPIVVGDKRLQHPSALVEREDGVGDGPDPKGLDGRLLALQQETTGLEAPDIASISIEDRTQVVPGQNLKVRVSAESIYTNISNVEVYLDVMDDSPEQNAKNFGQGNVLNSYPIEVSLPSDLEYGQHEIYVRVVDTNGEHSTAVKRFVVVDPATVVERDHIPKKPQVTIEVQGEDGNFYDPQELGWENKTYEPGDVITFRVTASDPDGIRRMSAEVHDSQRDESTRLDRLETISYGPGERENVQPQVSVISQWTVPEGIAASADLEQSLYWITVRAYDTREMSDVSQDLTFRVSRPSDAVAAGDIDWDGTEDDGDVGASGDYSQDDLAQVEDALDQSDQLVEGTSLPVDDRSHVGVNPDVTVYDLGNSIRFDANDDDSDILGYSLHLLDANGGVVAEDYHDSTDNTVEGIDGILFSNGVGSISVNKGADWSMLTPGDYSLRLTVYSASGNVVNDGDAFNVPELAVADAGQVDTTTTGQGDVSVDGGVQDVSVDTGQGDVVTTEPATDLDQLAIDAWRDTTRIRVVGKPGQRYTTDSTFALFHRGDVVRYFGADLPEGYTEEVTHEGFSAAFVFPHIEGSTVQTINMMSDSELIAPQREGAAYTFRMLSGADIDREEEMTLGRRIRMRGALPDNSNPSGEVATGNKESPDGTVVYPPTNLFWTTYRLLDPNGEEVAVNRTLCQVGERNHFFDGLGYGLIPGGVGGMVGVAQTEENNRYTRARYTGSYDHGDVPIRVNGWAIGPEMNWMRTSDGTNVRLPQEDVNFSVRGVYSYVPLNPEVAREYDLEGVDGIAIMTHISAIEGKRDGVFDLTATYGHMPADFSMGLNPDRDKKASRVRVHGESPDELMVREVMHEGQVRRAVVLPENYAVLEVMRAGELEEILWKIGDENLFAEGALVGGLIQAAYTSLFIAGMSQIPTEEVTPPPPEPEEPGVWVPGEEGPGTGPTH